MVTVLEDKEYSRENNFATRVQRVRRIMAIICPKCKEKNTSIVEEGTITEQIEIRLSEDGEFDWGIGTFLYDTFETTNLLCMSCNGEFTSNEWLVANGFPPEPLEGTE
ncbi:MAG: hypothetical protein ACTSQA_01225 [Candidatus Heimdallarchaeaceae archaeon]